MTDRNWIDQMSDEEPDVSPIIPKRTCSRCGVEYQKEFGLRANMCVPCMKDTEADREKTRITSSRYNSGARYADWVLNDPRMRDHDES